LDTGRALPLRGRVGKVHADIAETQRAQNRIRGGVEKNVGVRMTAQSEFSRYAYAAENQLAARLCAMRVPTLANPVSRQDRACHASGNFERRAFERQIETSQIHIGGFGDFDIAVGTDHYRNFYLFEPLD
jgi:hypothetical protein